MKPIASNRIRLLFILLSAFFTVPLLAQEEPENDEPDTNTVYVVTKNDGSAYTGRIIYQNERELLIATTTLGRLIIPMHEVKSIRQKNKASTPAPSPGQKPSPDEPGSYPGGSGTHYLLNTSNIPPKKDEKYLIMSWYGVDYHQGITDRFSIGLASSWILSPVAGSVKYCLPLGPNVHFTLGGIVASGTWIRNDVVLAVPYVGFGIGKPGVNLSLSYGQSFFRSRNSTERRPVLSIGGLAAVSQNFALVFDSVILPSTDNEGNGAQGNSVTTVSPSFRWIRQNGNSFQLGLCGVYTPRGDNFEFFPFPTFQFIRWIN